MSQPSRTTKTISMKQRSANQISTMNGRRVQKDPPYGSFFRTVEYFAADEIQIQKAKDEIHSRSTYQREDHSARAHDLAESLLRAEQSVNQPRLSTQLARHPSRRVRDERERKREHQNPQETMTPVETAANLL